MAVCTNTDGHKWEDTHTDVGDDADTDDVVPVHAVAVEHVVAAVRVGSERQDGLGYRVVAVVRW